jgi:hypothetical protein
VLLNYFYLNHEVGAAFDTEAVFCFLVVCLATASKDY